MSAKDNILENGLLADVEGSIFVFDDKTIANAIAFNQLGITEYILFEIDPKGFHVEPVNDNVAEHTATHQWIIKQPTVAPEFIEFIGVKEFDPYLQSLKDQIQIYDVLYPDFKGLKYKEKVLYVAKMFKEQNKIFYDYLMAEYRKY
jgi:hypothetical protein